MTEDQSYQHILFGLGLPNDVRKLSAGQTCRVLESLEPISPSISNWVIKRGYKWRVDSVEVPDYMALSFDCLARLREIADS